ncbi:MAG: calcium-binding protein, partial [Pseudomonadota bacterium]
GGANSSSFGGAGDDRIILSDGFSAIVDGGLDSDTVVFMNLNAGLTLNLATNSIAVGGQARSINLISIENAAGTDFDDFLTGNDDDNTFLGGAGADAHDGGVGVDTVDYSASDQVIAMSLESNVGTLGESTGDTYVSIENIIGTTQADFITGDANANRLEGGAENDNLNGRGGDDLVIGGDGDDSIIGFFGDDILRGGAGADDLNGGAGSDTADYSDAASRVALELYLGTGRIGDAENDTYTDIENVYGSQFNDYIVGDSGGNVLSGDLGFDNLIAAGGDDVLNGGKNGDQLDGGSGSDTASYEGSTGRVWVSLIGTSGVLNGFGFFGDAVGDTLISIENLQGTEFGDVLEGDAGDNILNGMERNDTLIGGDGNDQLIGGTGQDILQGGAGADLLDGGDGPDTVNYADATDRVAVELYINQARLNIAEGDQLISIENVVGSAFNDFIVGSGVANTIEGGAGVDFINSAGGNDIIIGGLAFDRIRTGMGNDEVRFSAGDGNDIIEDFTAGSGAGDVLSLSLGSAFDTFAEVIASASDVDGNAVLSFGSSGSITLEGVAVADLAEDDFIFPAAAVGGGATIQESIGLQMTSVGLQAEEPSELVYDESGETATVVTSEHIEGDAFLEFDVDSGIKLVCGCPSCHGLTDDAAAAAVAVQAVFIPDQTVEMRYVEGLQAFELAELDEHLV